jgi:type II secretory pathway pseudopilin PulG
MRETNRSGASDPESAEAGYMLLAVICMVALVLLSLAIAAPKVAAAIQRDRELELIHRGEQYKRAIRLYYKKFGNYPSSIDQLEKTNNIRFLRKRYLDPLTGKDDWKLVLLGQAHLCPLGFFGQPLGTGSAIAGATSVAALAGSTLGGSSATTGSSFGSSSLGSTTGSNPAVGSTGSSVPGCGTGGSAASPIGGGTGGSGSASDSGSSTGSQASQGGTGSSGSGASTTPTSTTLGEGLTPSTGFGAATSTTLGGAPIQGVMPPSTKATILLYKLKTHYNEWEFDYWPVEDQMAAGNIVGGGGNINGSGNSVNGPGSGSGNGSNPGPGGTGGSSVVGSSSIGSGFGSTSNGNGNSGQSGTNPP